MRFKEVLGKYGVTQTELAERLGINRVSVSRLLSEKNDMRSSTIIKIANAIGCSIGELYEDPCGSKSGMVCPNCGAKLELKIKE